MYLLNLESWIYWLQLNVTRTLIHAETRTVRVAQKTSDCHSIGFRFTSIRVVCIKGQLGVPLTVYPWCLLSSLGILGDEKTHKYPRAIGLFIGISYHDGVRWARGTSNELPWLFPFRLIILGLSLCPPFIAGPDSIGKTFLCYPARTQILDVPKTDLWLFEFSRVLNVTY